MLFSRKVIVMFQVFEEYYYVYAPDYTRLVADT